MKNLTYNQFAKMAIELASHIENEEERKAFLAKANHLATSNKSKGASAETLEIANIVENFLREAKEEKTAAEINAELKTNFTALRISNAVKYAQSEIGKKKVVREVISKKGLKSQKEYTAYYIVE